MRKKIVWASLAFILLAFAACWLWNPFEDSDYVRRDVMRATKPFAKVDFPKDAGGANSDASVTRPIATALERYQIRLKNALETYKVLGSEVLRANDPSDASIGTEFSRYRESFRQLVRDYRDYLWAVEDRHIDVPKETSRQLADLTAWFFGSDGLILKRHSPETKPTLQTTGESIDLGMERVAKLEFSLKAKLSGVSKQPAKLATIKGQYIVPRSELTTAISWLPAALDERRNRLPESYSKWEGRLKIEGVNEKKKVPFDFEREVWEFNSFRPVGSGIHFGATARYDGKPLNDHILRYDLKNRALVLTGSMETRDSHVYRMNDVSPEVLKPLYQFTAEGRNAAISIGWGMEPTSSVFNPSRDQAVLLDPYLVDTPIGQDLILTDIIPREFHIKELGGKQFYEQFGKIKSTTDAATEALLDKVFEGLPRYHPTAIAEWAEKNSFEFSKSIFDRISSAILEARKPSEAQRIFVSRLVLNNLNSVVNSGLSRANLPLTKGQSREDLKDGISRLAAKKLYISHYPINAYETSSDYADRILGVCEADIERTLADLTNDTIRRDYALRYANTHTFNDNQFVNQKIRDRIRDLLTDKIDKLFQSNNETYSDLLRGELLGLVQSSTNSSKGCPTSLLRLWLTCSLEAAKEDLRDRVCRELKIALTRGQTSLAVLMDVPGESVFTLDDGRIILRGKLLYRYARTRIEIRGDRVYFGKVPGDDREVETLDSLNEIANANLSAIERDLSPLVPPAESREKWREWEARTANLSAKMTSQRRAVPVSPLHSLHEIDGDFETQVPAAGGSNGVLVPPWFYEGKVAVTNAAQSPYKNLYPTGNVGVSIPAGAGVYRIYQAFYPSHKNLSEGQLHVNFDFRITGASGAKGTHRFSLGTPDKMAVVEIHLASDAVSVRSGKGIERVGDVKPDQWNNFQLTIDFKNRIVSGSVGVPGSISPFPAKQFAADWVGPMVELTFDSMGSSQSKLPGIELDNIGIRETPILPVSVDPPTIPRADKGADPVAIAAQLRALTGIDGDLELQTKDAPPAEPWNAGPNSVVKLSENAQSPFCNIYESGRLGLHMPNRDGYDGFGVTLPKITPDKDGRIHAGFDFRCGSQQAGGKGSWRYYLGHGPGNSAAVELFFNGSEFFRRSANARDSVAPLVNGEWYQVHLTLDPKAKAYSGTLESRKSKKEFRGEFATGWDGSIDYAFIDSYGHLGGVRPALDADNFVVRAEPLPALDALPVKTDGVHRARLAELRKQLATLQSATNAEQMELTKLVTSGPFEMAYGLAEGTPHGVHMQLRGEPDRPGEEVRRGTIRVLGGGPLPDGTPGSGRRELANWITRPDNPLTARVMVNRIWQHHFGRGLVKTPNDFGARGLPPTHPELLDHLASEFVRNSWSVKAMHRSIMLSETYQRSSVESAMQRSELKPDTTDLYASFPRRRLSAEEIRDSILAVSGELDPVPAREHPFPSPLSWGFSQHAPFSAVYDNHKRSVYLMTQRLKRHPFLALFDGADPNATTADRLVTTVPTQALFFLNDPFVHTKAEKWANRLFAARADERGRIELAWRQAFGRVPGEPERREATEFLAEYRAGLVAIKSDNVGTRAVAAYLRSMLGSNEFLYVD